MCVRELRAESPNVSVFYMAWVSLIAALFGCFVTPLFGFTHTFRLPNHWAEWVLLAGIGALPPFIPSRAIHACQQLMHVFSA